MTATKLCFWFAVAMTILGNLVTFLPGTGLWYFGVATIFALLGIFIPSRGYRMAAVALALFLMQELSDQQQLLEKEYRNSSNQPPDRTHDSEGP